MKVLIVDDSRAMRLIIRRHVEAARLADLEITEAGNGRDALDLIRADEPDLVFSDWHMPEMDGLELLRTLRSEGHDVRFGFVTSHRKDDIRDRAVDAGALFLIEKPFTADDFRAVLARVV